MLPIDRKLMLTIRKAAIDSNSGIHKIDCLLPQHDCICVLSVRTKKLVKRREFEEFISNSFAI